jgi:hypothetical protein
MLGMLVVQAFFHLIEVLGTILINMVEGIIQLMQESFLIWGIQV